MATDLTGPATPLGIGKYNVDADAPSGLGFNAAMDQIDAIISARLKGSGVPFLGSLPVWDTASQTFKTDGSVKPAASALATGTPDATKVFRGDGAWAQVTDALVASGAGIVQSKLAFDGWQSYAVTWTNAGTANTLTGSTLTGRYVQIGKTVHVWIKLLWGAGTAAGNSWWQFSLPVPASATNVDWAGWGNALDSSASARYALMARYEGSVVALYTLASPTVQVSGGSVPFIWATGDYVVLNFTYEAA